MGSAEGTHLATRRRSLRRKNVPSCAEWNQEEGRGSAVGKEGPLWVRCRRPAQQVKDGHRRRRVVVAAGSYGIAGMGAESTCLCGFWPHWLPSSSSSPPPSRLLTEDSARGPTQRQACTWTWPGLPYWTVRTAGPIRTARTGLMVRTGAGGVQSMSRAVGVWTGETMTQRLQWD